MLITRGTGNWFGGEAVSLQINYTESEQFRAAGYQPYLVDGEEYGEVREYGRFSFTRIYQAGHEGKPRHHLRARHIADMDRSTILPAKGIVGDLPQDTRQSNYRGRQRGHRR